jgi:hypothetical protein
MDITQNPTDERVFVQDKVKRCRTLIDHINSQEAMDSIVHVLTDANACYLYIMKNYVRSFRSANCLKAIDFEAKLCLVAVRSQSKYQTRTGLHIASRILGTLNTKFWGICHLALTFGDYQIDWRQDSLAIPKKTSSNKATYCAELHNITMTSAQIRIIAQVITKWNRNKIYSSAPSYWRTNNEKYGNCHEFIFDVLNALGVDLKTSIPNEHIRTKLEHLHNIHKDKAFNKIKFDQFKRKEELRSVMKSISGKKRKTFRFSSHEELDKFFIALRESPHYKESPQDFDDVFEFGKGFDLAYWLRDARKTSASPGCTVTCPFGDPYVENGLFKSCRANK